MKKIIKLICLLFATSIFFCSCNNQVPSIDLTVKWVDADGVVLKTEIVTDYNNISDFPVPQDTDKWIYDEAWVETRENTNIIYTIGREPQPSYFLGNVFQIVTKDLGNIPMATGSGFILNDEGWFITNHHVMEGAFFATAIFNIPDEALGESFTYLQIEEAYYQHSDKDIFIGKLTNYESIKSYYKPIALSNDYQIGGVSYSVGYPSSSIDMKINKGNITEEWSNIYDKLYSGNNYICSSSYIAPGSSGGILTNDNLDVIGMTTLGLLDEFDNFIAGASISCFNFANQVAAKKNELLQPIDTLLHSDIIDFVAYYKAAMSEGNATRNEWNDGAISYSITWTDEKVNDDGLNYVETETISLHSDLYLEYIYEVFWDNGDRRVIKLYGFYSEEKALGNLIFDFTYTYANNSYFNVHCDEINYSENVSLTLNKCVLKTSYNYQSSGGETDYAKGLFNTVYIALGNELASAVSNN